MRKLATIQKIESITSIPDADAIVVAQILGWKVVIKKGEFNVGDYVVYCEIDSLLPDKPEFEFLRKDKFRIRTRKFRGQISQGICFPISIFPMNVIYIETPEGTAIDVSNITELGDIRLFEIGTDVTDVLDIVKYIAPIPAELSGDAKGAFPSFMIITDEDRIQILPHIPIEHAGEEFVATEKLDGSSMSFFLNNDEFGVCGRNWEYYESPTNSMWRVVRDKKIEEKLRNLGRNLGVQGEIIGNGIQKNRYKIVGHEIRVFRMFDIDEYRYLDYAETVDITENVLGLKMVPVLDWNYILPTTVDEILEYAEGKSVLNPKTNREGVVFVRNDPRCHGRLSFKAISNKFLLKNEE